MPTRLPTAADWRIQITGIQFLFLFFLSRCRVTLLLFYSQSVRYFDSKTCWGSTIDILCVCMYIWACKRMYGCFPVYGCQLRACAYLCNNLHVGTGLSMYVCLLDCVCKTVYVVVHVWCVSEVRWYSRGVWSLHLLRTSEGVKSTDCPNHSHWDSNPRLSCAWASLKRQDREREMCVSMSEGRRMRERQGDRRERFGVN